MLQERHFRDMFYFAVESEVGRDAKKICGATVFDQVWLLMRNFNAMIDSFSPQSYFEDET